METPSSAAGLEGASALPGTPVTPSLTETLPPVVDLIYSAFLGSSTFVIGTVGYRFERDGDHYAIETLGRAQGIVALLFPGELRVRSRGRVSEKGLLPEELRVERGRADRIELARFDTVTETLELHDKPPQPLNPPTYDLLTFWLQFYFAPPAGDEVEFRVATTRQVRDYRLRRTAFETVATPLGEVGTQVWQRVGERADDADAVIWLAPLWNFLPVKVRLANRRGAVEQLLVGVRTGLVVPESMRDGPKLELPVDGEGRLVREEVPSERRHTP